MTRPCTRSPERGAAATRCTRPDAITPSTPSPRIGFSPLVGAIRRAMPHDLHNRFRSHPGTAEPLPYETTPVRRLALPCIAIPRAQRMPRRLAPEPAPVRSLGLCSRYGRPGISRPFDPNLPDSSRPESNRRRKGDEWAAAPRGAAAPAGRMALSYSAGSATPFTGGVRLDPFNRIFASGAGAVVRSHLRQSSSQVRSVRRVDCNWFTSRGA